MSDQNSASGGDQDAAEIVERLEAGAGAGHDPNFLPVETERAFDREDDDQAVADVVERLEAGAGAGHDPNFLPVETERAFE
jgi:hypothetical protein